MRAAAVLHVPRSPYSSVALAYEDLARAFEARGHSLEIVTPAELRAGPFDARFLPLVYPLIVRRWLARRPDLDLVLFHSYAGWLARRGRPAQKLAVAFHGFEPLFHEAHDREMRRLDRPLSRRYRAMYGRLMPAMLRVACRRADRVICLNSDERRAIVERGYAPAGKVWQAAHGAPVSSGPPLAQYRPRATTLAVVMQWLPTKGVRDLVEVFSALAIARPDLRLLAAGTLQPPETVRASFPEPLRSRVDVVPAFDHAQHADLLAGADLFLHTSVYEAFGVAIIEAMGAGLPVVTTRTGVAIDALTDDLDARVVPVGDPRAMTAAVAELLDDRDARRRLGMAGRRAAERLTNERATDALVDMLECLVAAA